MTATDNATDPTVDLPPGYHWEYAVATKSGGRITYDHGWTEDPARAKSDLQGVEYHLDEERRNGLVIRNQRDAENAQARYEELHSRQVFLAKRPVGPITDEYGDPVSP